MDEEKLIKDSGGTRFARVVLPKKQIILNNFIGGIFWSFGTIIGFAIVAFIVGVFLRRIDLTIVLGNWLSNIINHALTQVDPTQLK